MKNQDPTGHGHYDAESNTWDWYDEPVVAGPYVGLRSQILDGLYALEGNPDTTKDVAKLAGLAAAYIITINAARQMDRDANRIDGYIVVSTDELVTDINYAIDHLKQSRILSDIPFDVAAVRIMPSADPEELRRG